MEELDDFISEIDSNETDDLNFDNNETVQEDNDDIISEDLDTEIENNTQHNEENSVNESTNIKLSPAHFSALSKILTEIDKQVSTNNIRIENSTIIQETSNSSIIMLDLTQLFGSNSINIDICNPSLYIPLMKEMNIDSGEIFINKDDNNKQYTIDNGEIELYLPMNNTQTSSLTAPDISNCEAISQVKISKDVRKKISNLSKKADFIEYLIFGNDLKGIFIPDTALYVFENYKEEFKKNKFSPEDADLRLRTSEFLPIESEEYDFYIIKTGNDKYYLMADCVVGSGTIPLRIISNSQQSASMDLII